MAIYLECISALIRRDVIDARYPGGVEGFWGDCGNGSFVADPHLVRIGAMSSADLELLVDELLARDHGLRDTDVAIASRDGWLAAVARARVDRRGPLRVVTRHRARRGVRVVHL